MSFLHRVTSLTRESDRQKQLDREARRDAIRNGKAPALPRPRAAFLSVTAWLIGWGLVTWGLAGLTTGHWEAAVWRCSVGLLALGIGGPRLLWMILTNGIYALTAPRPDAAKETQR